MSDIRDYKSLRSEGARLGRAGLSDRVIDLVKHFDGSRVGAMVLAGRMKAIAHAASFDDYWSEKVGNGYYSEMREITSVPSPPETGT